MLMSPNMLFSMLKLHVFARNSYSYWRNYMSYECNMIC